MTVYSAYSSFRVAGFSEAKAFKLATDFMLGIMSKQAANSKAEKEDD